MRSWKTALVALAATAGARAANPAEFGVWSFDRYADGITNNSNDLPGRLYVPADYNPALSYPVVTFLHGLGETGFNAGFNNTAQVNSNIDNLLAAAKSRKFILYAPQVYSSWGTVDNLNLVANQLAKIGTQYRVDPSRMYITGLSLGGGGTIDLTGAYSHVFAAAVDICGSENGPALQPAALKNVPLWIHHGTSDTTVDVSVSRNRVNAIRNAKGLSSITFPVAGNAYDDGTLRYTEYPGQGHGIWGNVYSQAPVYDWMLSKTNAILTLQNGQSVKFDVGFRLNTAKINGETWNSTNYGMYKTVGPVVSFARTTDGIGTQVHLDITDTFAWENDTTASPSAGERGDSWAVTGGDAGGLRIGGLTPGGLYDIALFASYNGTGSTQFIINGTTQLLNYSNNALNTSLFQGLFADANGGIDITVQVAPGSGAAYVNSISITAVPEPGAMAALGAMAGLVLRRQRRA